jgi:hypothetical protein
MYFYVIKYSLEWIFYDEHTVLLFPVVSMGLDVTVSVHRTLNDLIMRK